MLSTTRDDTRSNRRRSWGLGPLSMVFAVGFLVAVVATVASNLHLRQSEADLRLLTHVTAVESRIAGLQLLLRTAQSSERAYLLTGRSDELDRWRRTIDATDATLSDLRTLAVDEAELREGMAALQPALERALEEMRAGIKLAEGGGLSGMLDALHSAPGDRLEVVQAEIDRWMKNRRTALERHMAESEEASFWLVLVRRTGVGILIVLVIVAVILVRRTAGEREAALQALATANAELEAKVAERTAEIRRTMDVLDNTINTMAAAVLVTDRNGIVLSNRAAERLLGPIADRTPEDWGSHYEVYLPDEITPLERDNWSVVRALRGEAVDNMEVYIRRVDSGRGYHLVASARPLRAGDGTIIGAVVVYHDITDQRQIERQLWQAQKLEAIGQLTGGIAHDFNNILTVITGTIDILARAVAHDAMLASITRMIDEAADRGSQLTRRLLAFARKQPLQPRPTDINLLILETTQLLRPTLGEQIEIETLLEGDTWPAQVDPSQLAAALINLALNARDAMPGGGKITMQTGNVYLDRIYVQMHVGTRPGPYVMVAVRDNGTGIPVAIRDKVFEPFFTTKETGKGTGLGLSMVYGFVKQSGGHIKIDSQEGDGTSINLYLPRANELVEVRDDIVPILPLEGGDETILVVEDDPLVRAFVTAQLQSLGYRTIAADDGPAALVEIDRHPDIDLLFTDVIMPGGLNGRQLADEAMKRRPDIRVLFTSGYPEDIIVHHGRLDDGVHLLGKPYRKADLARMIRVVLGSRATSASGEAA